MGEADEVVWYKSQTTRAAVALVIPLLVAVAKQFHLDLSAQVEATTDVLMAILSAVAGGIIIRRRIAQGREGSLPTVRLTR